MLFKFQSSEGKFFTTAMVGKIRINAGELLQESIEWGPLPCRKTHIFVPTGMTNI
jgi:hypothetical protein